VAAGGREAGGIRPPAALSRGRHFEGRKYGILKTGRFWQIDVCIAERFVVSAAALDIMHSLNAFLPPFPLHSLFAFPGA